MSELEIIDFKNQALHRLMGECWHEMKEYKVPMQYGHCQHCDKLMQWNDDGDYNTDYFSPHQPHSQIVALIQATVKMFGWGAVCEAIYEINNDVDISEFLSIPADEIAEAIYQMTIEVTS